MVHGPNFKKDVLFKLTTLANLILKGLELFGFNSILIEWPFDDCTITVRFQDTQYDFYCIKHYDSNIYLNPYFHEADITSFVYDNLKKGDIFIDVGAHCGLYTILASKKVGSKGRVISIEPNPENLNLLNMNIQKNNLRNVTIISKAVGEYETRINLFYRSEATALTSHQEGTKSNKCIEVETVTLDDVVEQLKINSIKMIKIDTEGYDEHVLRSGKRVLRKTKYLIVESNSSTIKRILIDNGFNICLLSPSQYILGINREWEDRTLRGSREN